MRLVHEEDDPQFWSSDIALPDTVTREMHQLVSRGHPSQNYLLVVASSSFSDTSLPPLDSKSSAARQQEFLTCDEIESETCEHKNFLHWLHGWLQVFVFGAWSSLHLSEDQFSLEFVPTLPYNMPRASSRQFGQRYPATPLGPPRQGSSKVDGCLDTGVDACTSGLFFIHLHCSLIAPFSIQSTFYKC